ncbi:MAG: thioredoxin family protein [bacterium]|nr:thioredoxin family protein [bacterium]
MNNSSETPSDSKSGSRVGAVVVIGLILLVVVVLYFQSHRTASGEVCPDPVVSAAEQPDEGNATENTSQIADQLPDPVVSTEEQPAESNSAQNTSQTPDQLPRFVDLGTTTCRPCQMMIPVMEELRTEYAGKLQVDFINVSTDQTAARQYNVRVIPLQIFFDPSGTELFRHQGYWPKEDILAKWAELGFTF